jgi:7,8-dihydropterin-6-yl-methyl-4-(beta-D-ribofuranosyl)aminobenzene 5'-phosphate synthase
MCDSPADPRQVARAVPRPVTGQAADPIALEPVDEVVITTLVDNVYDALLTGDERTTRAPFSAGTARAPQFEGGSTTVGLMAEHGFSALVSVRRGTTTTTLLFDTGLSPDAMITNAGRLGVDLSQIQAVVLSHGHFDHAGGLAGLAGRQGIRSLPMVIHPLIWERRQPSLLADGCVLITGEVDRTTDFEHGMPPSHQAWTASQWRPDPLVADDQALVVNVRGHGLLVLTGCGHAGAINIVRYAQRLTAVPALYALVGGLHLSGPAFEPIIGATISALTEMAPTLVVPGHCTGWRAQHGLAAALPDAWVAGSSGSSFRLSAA